MLGLFDNSAVLDLASPIEQSHPLNMGRVAWFLALPGPTGMPRFKNLIRSTALSSSAAGAAWVSSTRPGSWGAVQSVGTGVGWTATAPAEVQLPLPLSISMWWRTIATPTDGACFCGVGVSSGASPYRAYSFMTSGTYLTFNGNNNGTYFVYATTVSTTGPTGWNLAVAVYTTASVKVYARALGATGMTTFTSTATRASPTYTSPYLFIGKWQTGASQDSQCQVDDLAIWNRALSLADANALYEESCRGYAGTLRRTSARSIIALRGAPVSRIIAFHPSSSGMPSADPLD